MKRLLSKLRLSLSARLALWYGLSMLILLSLFVAYLYTSFHVSLHRDFADRLRRTERRLMPAVQAGAGASDFGRSIMPEFAEAPGPALYAGGTEATFVRLLSPEGRVLHRSSEALEGLRPRLPETAERTIVMRSWAGAPARTLYAPVRSSGGRLAGWLEITRLESGLHREMHRLAWLLAVGVVLGVGVAIASGYGLARRALGPVADVTRTANDIQATGLQRRLPTASGVRDELSDLADAFNGMLSRLEASFQREQHFRADAAHQLMTPLAAVQAETEIGLRKERAAADYQRGLRAIQERTRHMAGLVEKLLTLSRAEALETSGGLRIDLSRLAGERVEQAASRAEAQGILLEEDIAPGLAVRARVEDLEAILDNLLSNALKYTPEGSVRVSLHATGGEAALRVTDTGIGFEGRGEDLFNRFHRGAAPAVQKHAGTGLGLSIVRAVARAYGGSVSAHSKGEGRGSTFEVRLPRAA